MTNRAERASATAETAVALPALVLVLALCLWGLSLGATTLRCAEAARAAARVAARGEPPDAVVAAARRVAGPGAVVTTSADGDLLTVRVTARAAPPVPGLRGPAPAVEVTQAAVARVEPRAEILAAPRIDPRGGWP